MLLLKEIDEREALEKQVKEKFINHDSRINKLEEIVSSDDGYITIQKRLDDLDIFMEDKDKEFIFGGCGKICLEEHYSYKKSITGNRFDTKYPIIVIDKAIGIVEEIKKFS